MKNQKTNSMKTVSVQQQIAKLENELKLKAMLGREYFSDESQAMKLKLQNLKAELILQ